MSYARGTTNYNLPLTQGSDKRDWSDTNTAFTNLDAAVKTAGDTASSASSAASTAQTRADNAYTLASTANTAAGNAATAAATAGELAQTAKNRADSAYTLASEATVKSRTISVTTNSGTASITDSVLASARCLLYVSIPTALGFIYTRSDGVNHGVKLCNIADLSPVNDGAHQITIFYI